MRIDPCRRNDRLIQAAKALSRKGQGIFFANHNCLFVIGRFRFEVRHPL
ncbi:hypothetical protein SJA_C2-02750 [Sphingobium indicum UT26S]|uniref:Uncharacterized protein n=1 Tax=Sphingobium indicum (strain DSM 16413 / CCM 7287 / MTCC 6362 / UT26 / NBRC 101211 / UT26S) TaxID=452662 RepID=D4Z819_SPHIU|nr:hypothetical protein SJA_C2-02750 [Sphingobium indicum UT26S]